VKQKEELSTLQKRAKRKYSTNGYLHRLQSLDSPLHKSYNISAGCASTLTHEDEKVTAKYCNQRWCLVCNSIRTAKMITGYGEQIKELDNPYFMTLTVPNCRKEELKATLKRMDESFHKIYHVLRKRKVKLKAIRKLEITYNAKCDNYHPHYHLIVDEFNGLFDYKETASIPTLFDSETLNQQQSFLLCQIENFKNYPKRFPKSIKFVE